MSSLDQQREGSSNRGGALTKLLIVLVVTFAILALGWMLFLPAIVTTQLRQKTGFDATIVRLAVNPFGGRVEMRGFVVTNPPTFPVAEFLELREFRAKAQVRSLFSDRPIFDSMFVDAASVTLVKRGDGTTNAEAFQKNLETFDKNALVQKPESPQRQVLIRQLELRIDRLIVADHSLREPTRREFTLNLHQTYTDVTNIEQLLAPAALKQLAPVAIAIGGLLPGELGKVLTEVGGSSAGLLQEAGRKAGDRLKGFFDALEESGKP